MPKRKVGRRTSKVESIAGRRFGRMLVESERPGVHPHTRRVSLCVCDCGRRKEVLRASLLAGLTKSCGCLARESLTTHGMTDTPTFNSWQSMRNRCYRAATFGYEFYGGRGIAVCDRWRDSFEAFLEDMGERPRGTTLDRVDVNGHYEPGNCKWSTTKQQARNKRTTKLTADDVAKIRAGKESGESLQSLAEMFGVSRSHIGSICRGVFWKPDGAGPR